ncbi:MAG: hypothetical protein IPF57_07675 [Gammaproteobacteria bacterium]|nr:hypothetical protein [Gammaproteobacteria bacterium]
MTSPSTSSLTLQQPLNNIGRLAIMATACALAGAGETMTTPLHDEAHALPAEDAIRVGAAIQHRSRTRPGWLTPSIRWPARITSSR